MVNMGRMCDNNQEEAVLSTDAHMSFIKTIGLRAFDGVQLVFLYRPITKMPGLRSKSKLTLYSLACVLIVAKHDGYM